MEVGVLGKMLATAAVVVFLDTGRKIERATTRHQRIMEVTALERTQDKPVATIFAQNRVPIISRTRMKLMWTAAELSAQHVNVLQPKEA